MREVEQFYILAHMLISAIGAILLLAIWYNIKTRYRRLLEEDNSHQRVDKGLVYLSSALIVWVVSGTWTWVHSDFGFGSELVYQSGLALCSTANNLFILLALSCFSYAPAFLRQHKKNVFRLTVLIIVVAGSSIGLTFGFGAQSSVGGLVIGNLPDVLLSGFLSYLLMFSLYATFHHRKLPVVGVISVVVILLMFVSQLPEIFFFPDGSFANNLIKIVAKTSLISIFLVLATTWVIQLATTPFSSEMTIHFQDWSLIKITIPSKNILGQTLDFGSKTTQYRNLFKFAIRRKCGQGEAQLMLVGAAGELKSQTYLSRIIDNINGILEQEDDRKLDRKDLFTFVGQGQYRLRILPENIQIEENLLHEFTKASENQAYQDLVNQHNEGNKR